MDRYNLGNEVANFILISVMESSQIPMSINIDQKKYCEQVTSESTASFVRVRRSWKDVI